MIECPDCFRCFEVIWNNDGEGPPEYCPMCGSHIWLYGMDFGEKTQEEDE